MGCSLDGRRGVTKNEAQETADGGEPYAYVRRRNLASGVHAILRASLAVSNTSSATKVPQEVRAGGKVRDGDVDGDDVLVDDDDADPPVGRRARVDTEDVRVIVGDINRDAKISKEGPVAS